MRRGSFAIVCVIALLLTLPYGAHAQTSVLAPDIINAKYGAGASDKDISAFTNVTINADGATILRIERAYSSFKPWYYDTGAQEKAVALRLPICLGEPVRGGDAVRVGDAPYVVGALEVGQGLTLSFRPVKGGNTKEYNVRYGADGQSSTLIVQYVDLDAVKHFVLMSGGDDERYYNARLAEDAAKLYFDTALMGDPVQMDVIKPDVAGGDAYALRTALQVYDNAGEPLSESTIVYVEPHAYSLDRAVVFGCDASGGVTLDDKGVMNITIVVRDDIDGSSVDTNKYLSLSALRSAESVSAGKWDISALDASGEPMFVKTLSITVNARTRINTPMLSIAQGTSIKLEQGETVKLKANYNKNPNVDDARIAWSSSNPGIAEVSEGGALSALSPGVSYVKASIKGTSAEAIISVTVTALNPPRVYTVTRNNVNLRDTPDPEASSLALLARGDSLSVLSVRDGWAKVIWKDAPSGYGYVSERYLAEN